MPIRHVVAQGECLTSIAGAYGFADYKVVYDDPLNAAFKKKRQNPNVIQPGDVLMIPDRGGKELPRPTGRSHTFTVRLPQRLLRLALHDHEGNALASADYVLEIQGRKLAGKTDGDGLVEQKIPIAATEGTMTLPKYGVRWGIRVGHLDPVHDDDGDQPIVSGMRERLVNLGYSPGAGDDLTDALADFQRKALGRDEPDGVPDRATRDALVARHGC